MIQSCMGTLSHLRVKHAASKLAAQPEGGIGAAAGDGLSDEVLSAGDVKVDAIGIDWACPETV